ncbi:MAG: aspartate--tRNA(Asn) ligase [Candidatus Aenigmarchaeota archaeon]|nr:aspartate--tRNA(Asn) ligase [Candidatus Aenigmarchaeota archaeon]
MQRTYSSHVKVGNHVMVKGWIAKVRDLGGLKFFLLRDRTGTIQVTAKKGKVSDAIIKKFGELGREDCVSVEGKVTAAKQAPGGRELVPEKLEIVSKSETKLPIDVFGKIESGKDKRFDFRFLDIRDPKLQAIFRIKAVAINSIRDYFVKSGFIEVHTPVIQAAGAEGGATMFPVIYYNREAFLRQSPQLYKQMLMASGMDGVFEIGQAFRAEKFHTSRHVSEFLSVDFEQAWIESEEDIMNTLERMVAHSLREIAKDCKDELETLGRKVKVPELPLRRVTYDDMVKTLSKAGTPLEWGDDIEDAQERKMGEILAKKGIEWYFITKFPSKIKPFYIMLDGEVSRGLDLDYKGLEMASGGQREHRYDILKKVMKQKGLDPHKFEFYLEPFRYGMPPHGGIGFGVERMVEKILDLPDIKEAILFPRTPERLVP